MQLIFSDPYYDSEGWREDKFLNELTAELSSIDPSVRAFHAQLGRAADWPVVLVELFRDLDWSILLTAAGAGGFFMSGDKVNKSIDGWISVARKLRSVITRLKPVRIDERAAVLQVLTDIDDELARNLTSLTVRVEEFTPTPWNEHELSKRPDALYIVTTRTESTLHVYGITSSGKVEFKHRFDTAGMSSIDSGLYVSRLRPAK